MKKLIIIVENTNNFFITNIDINIDIDFDLDFDIDIDITSYDQH